LHSVMHMAQSAVAVALGIDHTIFVGTGGCSLL
jgi:hypothetical protein